MILNLSNGFDLSRFKEYTIKLINERAMVDIKKKHPRRSLPQNAYLHLILGWFALEYGCTIEEAKLDFYKRKANYQLYVTKKTNKRGEDFESVRSSKELTTEEMTLSIDRFRNYSSIVAGIYLPEPNEEQFLIHIQNEIEHNAYL
jgi:hypothetical protein